MKDNRQKIYRVDFHDTHRVIIKHELRCFPLIFVTDQKGNSLWRDTQIIFPDKHTIVIEFIELKLFKNAKKKIYSGTVFYTKPPTGDTHAEKQISGN